MTIEVDAQVSALEGDSTERITGCGLATGRSIACDAALIGVGAVANDELARDAGLTCHNGIVGRPGGANRRSGDLRHRRLHQPAAAAV